MLGVIGERSWVVEHRGAIVAECGAPCPTHHGHGGPSTHPLPWTFKRALTQKIVDPPRPHYNPTNFPLTALTKTEILQLVAEGLSTCATRPHRNKKIEA